MQILIVIVALIIILTYLMFIAQRSSENIASNFGIISKILQTNVEKPYFNLPFYVVVRGNYLGRQVYCRYLCFINKPEPEIYIEPRLKVRRQVSANITDNTYFSAGKIYYRYQLPSEALFTPENKLLHSMAKKKLSEPEIKDFLEELTLAANMFETGPRY